MYFILKHFSNLDNTLLLEFIAMEIHNKKSLMLVDVMTGHKTGTKPLPETMISIHENEFERLRLLPHLQEASELKSPNLYFLF